MFVNLKSILLNRFPASFKYNSLSYPYFETWDLLIETFEKCFESTGLVEYLDAYYFEPDYEHYSLNIYVRKVKRKYPNFPRASYHTSESIPTLAPQRPKDETYKLLDIYPVECIKHYILEIEEIIMYCKDLKKRLQRL